MKDKILRIFSEVDGNRPEIEGVYPSGSEYYFTFRGRVFSVSSSGSGGTFYVYPRYKGDVQSLANANEHGIEHPDLLFVNVTDEEIGSSNIEKFHSWLQSKHLGLDDLLRDIGL